MRPLIIALLLLWMLSLLAAFSVMGCDADDADDDDTDDDIDDDGADDDDAIWRPAPGTSWQWQLSGAVDTSFDVEMYDIDLFDTPVATIDALRAQGRSVICNFSAGSIEDWRPDAGDFPDAAIGEPLEDWEGEDWLDVRSSGVREVMLARLALARDKGCDGVEPDNVDGYANDSGFDLSADDQLDYNRFLAQAAHARGLSVGLKNDLEQVAELLPDFDWALNEECLAYDECAALDPFIEAGKAVFHVEYVDDWSDAADRASEVCGQQPRFSTLIKLWDLTAERLACDQ